ncbi:MAG: hypothetical protein VYE22_28195 [Myxococcota bacterium]|nr:hypothetical protein [Myxococcota bacterium]
MRRGLVVAAALSLIASVALAQQVPRRRVGVNWREGVPQLDFRATDLADAEVREILRFGPEQRLVMRVYAYRANGEPITLAIRQCNVSFDPWLRTYHVQVQDERRDATVALGTEEAMLDRCLVARQLPLGRASDWREVRGESVYFAAVIELNPISPAEVQRIRRWLARPVGGGRVGGTAFFGSFVSLFVNRRIGEADRTLRFRSQSVRVR